MTLTCEETTKKVIYFVRNFAGTYDIPEIAFSIFLVQFEKISCSCKNSLAVGVQPRLLNTLHIL